MKVVRKMNLRVGRQVVLIAGITLAVLIVGGLSYVIQRATEQQIADHFNEQQLHLAREAAIRIEDLFVAVLSSLELAVSLAEDNQQSGTLSPHDVRALFESLQEKAPIDSILLVEAEGKIQRIHPSAAAERPSVRQVVRRVVETPGQGGPRIIMIPVGDGVTRRHIAVAVPIGNEKTARGAAVVGVLDLEALLELHINSIRSGQNGYAWLMDSQGTLLHHPRHPEMVNRNILGHDPSCRECHASFELERQMAAGRTGLARLRVARDSDLLLAYHPVRLAREEVAVLDLDLATSWTDPATFPALRTKARQVAEELSQALGRPADLKRADVLGKHLASLLAAHTELKAVRVWSATPRASASHPVLLGYAPPGAASATHPSPGLTGEPVGNVVVVKIGAPGGPGARVLLPLPLAVDLWSVAVAAPYSDLTALVRASTLRIWGFSGTVLLLLLAAGVIVTRISDEKAMAEERARNAEDLLRMHKQMEQSRRLSELGQMVAQVAHEVRNPLLTVSSGVELLRAETGSTSEAAGLVSNVREAIRRLDGIVGDLLNFTRPMVLDPVEADVHSAIDSTLAALRDRITTGRIEVVKRYGTLPPITADTLKLSQLLMNLFVNAAEAMPQGGKLTVSTEWVAGRGVGNVRVRVQDTGAGIPVDKMSQIFEPFVTTKKRGIGLGLAVVRRIAELHGGRVDASNLLDGGADFLVELPIAPPPHRPDTMVAR